MTTTDTDALRDRIAIALAVRGQDFAYQVGPIEARALTAAVLPIVAEEVRKAKAEALREMQEHHEREADKAQTITARGIHLAIADGACKRATEYETGDSDERR